MTSPVLNHRYHLALEMLVNAGGHGCTDMTFIARFTPELFNLVRHGLATAEREITIVRGRPFEAACIRITAKGVRAIKAHGSSLSPNALMVGAP